MITTYHNVGMMHWAVVFWGWLEAARLQKLLLLDLDGLTCELGLGLGLGLGCRSSCSST